MKRRVATGLSAAAFAVLAAAGAATAQDKKPVELKYTTGAPPKTVWATQAERYVKDVDEGTKGAVKVNLFLGAQLGNEQDTMQQVQRGRIDMGGFSVAAASLIVPELSVMNIPFLFESAEVQDCVLDKHLTNFSKELLTKKGLHMVGWSHVGVSHVIGTKPFVAPADVKGMKARSSPTKIGAAFWTALGANPNPIGITEWSAAHQSGLVQVSDSGATFYVGSGLNKIVPVVTLTGHIDAPGIVLINKRIYDGIPAADRAAFDAASAKSGEALLRKEVRDWEARMIALHKGGGGTVVELTPEQRAAWRNALVPHWEKMVKEIGSPDADKMWKLIQDGKKACGAKAS